MALVGLLSSVMHACCFRKLEKKVRKRNIPKVDFFLLHLVVFKAASNKKN